MDDVTEKKVNTLDQALRPSIQDVGIAAHQHAEDGLKKLAEDMKEVVSDLASKIKELEQQITQQFNEQITELRATLDSKVDKAKKKATAESNAVSSELEKEIRKVRKDIQVKDEALEVRIREDNAELNSRIDNVEEQIKAAGALAQKNILKCAVKQETISTQIKRDSEAHLMELDEECNKLRNAVSEVENLSPKKVDWVIKDVSKRIRPNSASKASLHKSWFSPRFNVAGAHGLQLEMQLYRPSDPPQHDEGAGDTAVFLWACKGLSLVYRLYIGNKYHTCEKVFNGRVPFGTKRLCFMADQINRTDDTLTISVEILECHREIDRIIEQPPEADETEIPGLQIERPLDGRVQFHRYVNNRVFEQVKDQVDLMRSRMVRRVEWRVEQASKLRACFPYGESICSAQFMAAGIEGFQLIFYPCGYKGTTDGFCSLFVYGPAGCTVKCVLSVGPQKREANHSFEEPGAFGRTNFCRYDSIIDESDDTVMIALDIEEAHLDTVARTAHPTVAPGDRRSAQQLEGSRESAVHSVVKLTSTPGKASPGLDHACVLPSLWTVAMKDSAHQPGDNMRSFDELKKGHPLGRGEGASPAASPGSTLRMPRAHSTPSLAASRGVGGTDVESTTPLPPLPGSDCVGSSASARRRQRRTGGSNTSAAAAL
jgi:hypothetical protein